MSVCAKNRKGLALLALGAVEEREAEALRAHAASCAGCRGYLREMERVAESGRAAEAPETMEASPFLHRRLRHRLLEERPHSGFGWRLLGPALALLVFLFLFLPRNRPAPSPNPPAPPPSPVETVNTFDPSILNYQMAADQSLEKLDAVLSQQGNRALPAAPVYHADSRSAD
jgi:hypothetical protein